MSSDSPQASPSRCFTLPLKIKILACTQEDLPRLEWYGLFTRHRKIIRSTWERTLQGAEVMLVARVRDFPVGQVWIDLEKHQPRRAGEIWALRVFPFLRGKGIGRKLIFAAEAELRSQGFRRAELGVKKHSRAIPFYERLGYQSSGTQQVNYTLPLPEGERQTVSEHHVRYWKDL